MLKKFIFDACIQLELIANTLFWGLSAIFHLLKGYDSSLLQGTYVSTERACLNIHN